MSAPEASTLDTVKLAKPNKHKQGYFEKTKLKLFQDLYLFTSLQILFVMPDRFRVC